MSEPTPTPIADAFFHAGYPRTQIEIMEQMQSLERSKTDAMALVEELQKKLKAPDTDSIVGSCDCGAKTPDAQYHLKGCRYRLIVERDAAVHEKDQAVKEANRRDAKWMAGIEEVCGRKIRFDLPEVKIGGQDPTLSEFIHDLRSTLAQAEEDRDWNSEELKKLSAEKITTFKQMAALLLTLAIYPNCPLVTFPSGWADEGEVNPDLSLGTGNDYWLRTNHEKDGALYLQVRYLPISDLPEVLRRCVRVNHVVAAFQEKFGIEIHLPWDVRDVEKRYWDSIAPRGPQPDRQY